MANVSDDFNRGSLGSNWTVINGSVIISASTVIKGGTEFLNNVARWDANTFDNDQFCQIYVSSDTDGGGCCVRMPDADFGGYNLYTTGTTCHLFRIDAGPVFTLLGAVYSINTAVGEYIKLTANGTTLTPNYNGSDQSTRTDSTYTGGKPGVYFYSIAGVFDDWSAGPIVGAPNPMLRPSADDTDGGWIDSSAGTNLYAQLDEVSASDADFIRSANNPTADTCKIHLSNPGVTLTTPVNLRVRYAKEGPGTVNLTVKLFEGSTELWSKAYNGISASFTTATETAITLNQPISDETNLYVQFIATAA